MSEEKRIVHELPELSEFPALPNVPDGSSLVVFDSPLRKLEKEVVLGFLATVAIRCDGWKPVSVYEFMAIMQEKLNPMVSSQNVINAMWAMNAEGLLEVVRHAGEETDYLIPTVELVDMLSQSVLRAA